MLVYIVNNVIFDDTGLRCGSCNFAGLSPGNVEGGQVMSAQRRDFAPSWDGEQQCYLMPVEEKECADSVRQLGLGFKMAYSKIRYKNNLFTDDFIYLEDENLVKNRLTWIV